MKWIISPEQNDFFQTNGYLLLKEAVKVSTDDPIQFLRTRTISQAIGALLRKSPIRFVASRLINEKFGFPNHIETGFAIQGLLGGLLISPESGDLFFFHIELPGDQMPKGRWQMILLGGDRCVILHNPRDPIYKALKAQGYHQGDFLKQSTHPIIYR